MTDQERIATLERQIERLNAVIVGLACGHTLTIDGLGNPVVVVGSGGHPAYTGAVSYNPYNT
jgi:hypothetical protein